MNLSDLIDKTFQENEIFEILHFDIEQDYTKYFSKFVHIYFEPIEAGRIQISDVSHFPDEATFLAWNRKILGTRGWIEICHHSKHIDLVLCRKDRSGKLAITGPTLNLTQNFGGRNHLDDKDFRPLTEDEKKAAFAELAGVMDTHIQTSKSKIAV